MPTDLVGSHHKTIPNIYPDHLDLDLIMIGNNLRLMQEEKRSGPISSFPPMFLTAPRRQQDWSDGKAFVDPGVKVMPYRPWSKSFDPIMKLNNITHEKGFVDSLVNSRG
jgi:hypothetical protein